MASKFIEFLKKNNALQEFANNIKTYSTPSRVAAIFNSKEPEENVQAYTDHIDEMVCRVPGIEIGPKTYISMAFDWSRTGNKEYWSSLEAKWLQELEGSEVQDKMEIPEVQDKMEKIPEFQHVAPKEVVDAFAKNFREQRCIDVNIWLRKNRSNKDLVGMAFDWSKTEEGFGYWEEVSEVWERLCRKIEEYNEYKAQEKLFRGPVEDAIEELRNFKI